MENKDQDISAGDIPASVLNAWKEVHSSGTSHPHHSITLSSSSLSLPFSTCPFISLHNKKFINSPSLCQNATKTKCFSLRASAWILICLCIVLFKPLHSQEPKSYCFCVSKDSVSVATMFCTKSLILCSLYTILSTILKLLLSNTWIPLSLLAESTFHILKAGSVL